MPVTLDFSFGSPRIKDGTKTTPWLTFLGLPLCSALPKTRIKKKQARQQEQCGDGALHSDLQYLGPTRPVQPQQALLFHVGFGQMAVMMEASFQRALSALLSQWKWSCLGVEGLPSLTADSVGSELKKPFSSPSFHNDYCS